MIQSRRIAFSSFVFTVLFFFPSGKFFSPHFAFAQLSERPGSYGDARLGPRDLSGYSIKDKRVRAVHSQDSALEGTSFYFQEKDPWLAFQRGKNLTQREFRARDGAFGQAGNFFGRLTSDKITPKIDRDHTNSCAVCHNVPYRDAGAGITIAKNGGDGRNTPHFFGGGLVEMVGLQTRLKVFEICDPEKKGFIPKNLPADRPVRIRPAPGGAEIDYGFCGDTDGNGAPDLNKIFRVWYTDPNGKRVFDDQNGDGVVDLRDPNVAGYNFEMAIFGWGDVTGAMTATLRTFYSEPADTHSGMQAYDPTTNNDDGNGLARISNAGAQQFALHATPDRGQRLSPLGISLDDPDGDGFLNEVSEGDLDLAEWYMLNAPSPAVGARGKTEKKGEILFHKWKCAGCHTPDWRLEPQDPANPDPYRRYSGDRRFFDVEVRFNEKKERLEGRVRPLFKMDGDRFVPLRGGFTVKGVYSDFKHHDLGPAFHETQFDGSRIKAFRTAPLWGVGSTAPYGHDGKNLSLDAVIRRHGGEAQASSAAYRRAASHEREALVAFLSSLVLYQTDTLPTDIDGDGVIQEAFKVAGKETGIERFNPENLFNHPCKIEGPVSLPGGEAVVSHACTNIAQAYQEDLPYIRDQDNDGFPDVSDPCPQITGYLDGCRMTLSSPPPAEVRAPVWERIGGPEGGNVNVLALDPQNPAVVYAGLDGGGLFKSVDGGQHWEPHNQGLFYRDVMAIAIDRSNPRVLYAGTGRGLFKSTDGAHSWDLLDKVAENPIVMTLEIHPRSPETVYMGTAEALYKSTDGGKSWRKLHAGLPHHAHVHGFLLDSGMATTPSLDQGPTDTLFVALEGKGVYRSHDGGENWVAATEGLADFDIRPLAQNPQVPSLLYAGSLSHGIYRSADGGDHWAKMENVLSSSPINSLAVDPVAPNVLYAAVEGKGLYRSEDSGKSWAVLSVDDRPLDPTYLLLHPWSPSNVIVGTRSRGVFVSADGGRRWTSANNGLTNLPIQAFLIDPRNLRQFYLGTSLGLFISRDGGKTWEEAPLAGRHFSILTLVYDPDSGRVVVGADRVGVFSSADDGKTWQTEQLAPAKAAAVNFIWRGGTIDYVGGFGGLFRRNGAAGQWQAISGKDFSYPQILSVAIDPQNPLHLYVGSESGVFESPDGGSTWGDQSHGIESRRVRNLFLNPSKPKILYLATQGGFYRSDDGGASWTQPPGAPQGFVRSLVCNPQAPEQLFIGTPDGTFMSTNEGLNWTRVPSGVSFTPLAIDQTGLRLYGTDGTGLWGLSLVKEVENLNQAKLID